MWELVLAGLAIFCILIYAALRYKGQAAKALERFKQARANADAAKKGETAYKRARGGLSARARRFLRDKGGAE